MDQDRANGPGLTSRIGLPKLCGQSNKAAVVCAMRLEETAVRLCDGDKSLIICAIKDLVIHVHSSAFVWVCRRNVPTARFRFLELAVKEEYIGDIVNCTSCGLGLIHPCVCS